MDSNEQKNNKRNTVRDTETRASLESEKTVFRSVSAQKNTSDAKSEVIDRTVLANKVEQQKIAALRYPQTQKIMSHDDATQLTSGNKPEFENSDATLFRAKSLLTQPNNNGNKFRTAPQNTPPESDDAINLPPESGRSNKPHSQSKTKILKGRFVLEEVLGVGGMGVVYKAKDLLRVEAQDKDPYVAIKVLSEEFKAHPEAFISLQRESKKSQHIANQNTVKVYDFDRDGDVVFMTMEYMIGQPLDEVIKQYHVTGLPRNEAWGLLQGMCAALVHAHRENIVHSDLKPGNVFITEQGIAKIFDFGIARAVATIDRSQGDKDKTVFDAGNLGALTPAYASREMLLGEVPDVRDDIYALGCIAYEMLTGYHPFTRLPADEAYNKKLKPKRIQGIKKRHWKAIEAALAFKREDRIVSVAFFLKQITEKKKTNIAAWLLFASALAVGGYAYIELTKVEAPKVSQEEMMNRLEFKVRYKLLQENIDKLLANVTFSEVWQVSLWDEMQTVADMFLEKPTPWYFSKKETIYLLYIEQIKRAISAGNVTLANTLIKNAARYSEDLTLLDQLKFAIEQLNSKKMTWTQSQTTKNRELEEAKKRKAALAWEAKQAWLKDQNPGPTKKRGNAESYNVAMNNVEQQLRCTQRLNMRDFKIAIEKLRSLDVSRYQKSEKKITQQLSSCITTRGKTRPALAKEEKRSALLLFIDNPIIKGIAIKDMDGCQLSIAGLGARGARATCKDSLKVGGNGPTMLVVPAGRTVKAFAIGKYEVTVGEYNLYCKKSKACKSTSNVNKRLPKTQVSIRQINGYIKWLNKVTGKKYRLPTQKEWRHASIAKNNKLDSNRNCKISSRGIEKGNELIKTTTGKQNRWGLVNSAGNAQELVYGAGRKLVAVGGSYKTSMDICTNEKVNTHTGKADKYTGFRLARKI